jgi:hypothetical protein
VIELPSHDLVETRSQSVRQMRHWSLRPSAGACAHKAWVIHSWGTGRVLVGKYWVTQGSSGALISNGWLVLHESGT